MNQTLIYKNPTQQEIDRLASDGQVKAIFTSEDVYAWNPPIASHDDVFKALGLDESAIYAIIDVVQKTVRPVRRLRTENPCESASFHQKIRVVDEN